MGTRFQYGGFEKRKVECFDSATKVKIGEYESMAKASAMVGVSTGSIAGSCKVKKYDSGGCRSRKLLKKVYFRYKED